MTGIRSEIRIGAPTACPIARISQETGATSHAISRSVAPDAADRVTEEFTLDGDVPVDAVELDEEITRIFSYGSTDVYRFTRDLGAECPCTMVETFDCPVVDAYTQDGALYVTFHAPDIETLQDVIGSLKGAYPGLTVEQLFRSQSGTDESELVVFDRSVLTNRQREVLTLAHDMGYFDHPKGANAGEVADALGITTSTFTEHLAAAQQKLLAAVLDGRTSSPTPGP